ncbi:STAS domain-containing protein [Sulfitobacter sp.]|jgi:anti-sigma B factor antagonist|uniref:STAS domain-containing protein n=1 Tax=Sulfitobacter sp. TaxID=1903071 RepID=UPI000C0CE6BB|nr:anti-anti-sigma factor [Roseobacter sp.]MBV49592.1 anti-anti-sigma factor [Roseobacter sp.]PHR07507.1 MAG: anti-anti-sigma factor [Sulfitobacter sp.]|tara:strand:- start:3204 stop:3545 length:342 start_codon:yes stop_codon:yes gene_type:complete
MELLARTEGPLQLVSVVDDRIDAAVALVFKDHVRRLTSGGTGSVILDLQKVTFIDSSGLGAIIAIMKNLAPDRALLLAGLTGPVARVFRLTRMDSVFSIYPTLDVAVEDRRNA